MTFTLNLPPELETELHIEAARLNLSLPEYVLQLLSKRQTSTHSPKTGADLVKYWQREGVIGSRPDIVDSQAYARQIRHDAESRDRD
jgi:hypothetical protein